MSYKSLLKVSCFLLVGIFILSGCASIKQKIVRHGPPSHAPAHGYHKKYSYCYYPSSYVYYDANRGLYFYMKSGAWRSGSSLPSFIHIDSGEVIVMKLDTDKPYTLYSSHKFKYPPGQTKIKLGKAKGKRKVHQY